MEPHWCIQLIIVTISVYLVEQPFGYCQYMPPMPLMPPMPPFPNMPPMPSPTGQPIPTSGLPPVPGMPSPNNLQPSPTIPLGIQNSTNNGATMPSLPSTLKIPRFPTTSFNFTNSTSFSSSSQSNAFSIKDISHKLTTLDESGKPIEKNLSLKEFTDQQSVDVVGLGDLFQLKKFKNETTELEDKIKLQDGNLTQREMKNSGIEAYALDSALNAGKTAVDSMKTPTRRRRDIVPVGKTPDISGGGKGKLPDTSTGGKTKLPDTPGGKTKLPDTPASGTTKKLPETPGGGKTKLPGGIGGGGGDKETADEDSNEATPEVTTTRKPIATKSQEEEEVDEEEEEESEPSSFTFRNDEESREVFGIGKSCTKDKWEKCKLKSCPGIAKLKEPIFCLKSGESIYLCHLNCMKPICGTGDGLDVEKISKPGSKIEKKGKCSKNSNA